MQVVVAYTPGGANDVSERLKQSFVVEKRPGASGISGTVSVAKADADGYTLLLGAGGTMTINADLFAKLPYDPVKDFVPIGIAARSPLMVVVPTSQPVRSVTELHESGLRDFDVTSWFGLFAPQGTPREVVAQFGALVRSENERWRELIRQAGIKAN